MVRLPFKEELEPKGEKTLYAWVKDKGKGEYLTHIWRLVAIHPSEDPDDLFIACILLECERRLREAYPIFGPSFRDTKKFYRMIERPISKLNTRILNAHVKRSTCSRSALRSLVPYDNGKKLESNSELLAAGDCEIKQRSEQQLALLATLDTGYGERERSLFLAWRIQQCWSLNVKHMRQRNSKSWRRHEQELERMSEQQLLEYVIQECSAGMVSQDRTIYGTPKEILAVAAKTHLRRKGSSRVLLGWRKESNAQFRSIKKRVQASERFNAIYVELKKENRTW